MREATRSDRPMMGTISAQCPLCWRIFQSDTLCETHKPYARLPGDAERGRVAEREGCTDPLALGLIARERADGVVVWSSTTDEELERRTETMAKARAARVASAAQKRKARK